MRQTLMASADPSAAVRRAPIWPLIIAPLAAGIYYLVLKSAFAQSIISVLGKTAATDIDLSGIADPQWGTHWVYRLVAEFISVAFGIFVAAALARGREFAAAVTAGCAISFGFLVKFGFMFILWKYGEAEDLLDSEPWYQYVIDGLMVVMAPLVGMLVVETAQDLNRQEPHGFVGINRFHLLWLWIAAFWYGLGLITPMSQLYGMQGPSIIHMIITLLINFIPAAAVAIPGYYGLAFLSGHHGNSMHPAGRNLVGVLVLIFGFAVGGVIQTAWYYGAHKVWTTLFG